MSELLALHKKITRENGILLLLFLSCFLFFIFQEPLFSPDTYSYLRADITRFPGYILYLRALQLIFGEGFAIMAVVGHLLFGFVGIYVIFKNCAQFFSLSLISKILLLLILLFPYFYPIEIAINLTSEGIAYPLYLLLISFSIDFLFRNRSARLLPLCLIYFALVLTRGQFVVVAPILAFVYFLKQKKAVFQKNNLICVIVLLLLPLATNLLDKTYRSIFYGYFSSTPYSYVNAVTLPLYVSQENDYRLFDDKEVQDVFRISYHQIDSLGLLSSKVDGSYQVKYKVFHNNFPKICNQNLHENGMAYYRDLGSIPPEDAFQIEAASRQLFSVLIRQNLSEWTALYLTGILHGFKSVFILFFVLVLAVLALWKVLKNFGKNSGFILLACLLILSNAMIVALASHSIMRYLFYNYFFGLLILVILLKKFIPKNES